MQVKSLNFLARLGYAARGVVYLMIGGLALLAVFGTGEGQTVGSKGALATLAGKPWGLAALVLIAIGLFGYAIWRSIQGLFDADDQGSDAKGIVMRVGSIVSAVTHVVLGIYAISLPFTIGAGSGGGGGAGGSGVEGPVAWLMQQPFGRYVVSAVGVAIIGAGVVQLWRGFTGKYRKHLMMRPDLMEKLAPICTFGLAARGVVFLVVGGFVLYAAYTVDPDQAGGLAEALRWLRAQSYGTILFLIVAAGLFAFGIYSVIEAIWRRVDTSDTRRKLNAVPGA